MADRGIRLRATRREFTPPITLELRALFLALPDEKLIAMLRGRTRRGRRGYDPTILWRCFVAYYVLGLPSVSDLIRILHNNPYIASACGIYSPAEIPSQPTFSRFYSKLAKPRIALAVKNIMRELTRQLFRVLPDFGKVIIMDSTVIKGWSNGAKRGKNRKGSTRRQAPKVGVVSDPDAGWAVKDERRLIWGYKVHLIADAVRELPLAVDTTPGNVADISRAQPLLSQLRSTCSTFNPTHVICDAAYSSESLRMAIKCQYRANPIIDPNPRHKRAFRKVAKTPEWKLAYNRRNAIERLNSRLKIQGKLNTLRGRGRWKAAIHTLLSVIVCQLRALVTRS